MHEIRVINCLWRAATRPEMLKWTCGKIMPHDISKSCPQFSAHVIG